MSATVNGLTSSAQIGALVLGGLLAAALSPRQVFVLAGLLGVLAPIALGRRLLASLGRADTATGPAARSTPPGPTPLGPTVTEQSAVPAHH
ncbi:MAG: hypothetical protein ACR2N4_06450 [Jatrophihabitans sp.]